MTYQRMEPEARAREILEAAVLCAERDGFDRVTRERVAVAAGCSPALISYHYVGWGALLEAVMVEAVARPIPCIVARGLAAKHPTAMAAPAEVKTAAAASLVLP